jgi:hypothetical protein
MNTALSGSGRVDDIQSHPQGEIRGQTNLVKITEDVRKYAAEHGLTNAEAIESSLKEKSREFVEQRSDVYAKT